MYAREEHFWSGRLSVLQQQANQPYGAPGSQCRPRTPYMPPSMSWLNGASAEQAPASGQSQPGQEASPTATQVASAPAGQLVAPPPSSSSSQSPSSDALVHQAQVEALKLQVVQLRRANTDLQRQLAAAAAERAAAARTTAIQQLVQLRLPGDPPAAAAAAQDNPTVAAALRDELGVVLPPAADAVPLAYLQKLHDTYQQRLVSMQQQHRRQVQQQQDEHERQLSLQAERQQRELCLLAEQVEDPSRDAEVQLLRDDCRFLKDKLQQLAGEYQRRVEVAAAEARLTAQRQAAEERRRCEAAAGEERRRLEQQLRQVQEAAAVTEAAAWDAAALERARHSAELARLAEEHRGREEQLKAEFSATLAQREQQYNELLAELRGVRSAMNSRAGTPLPGGPPQGLDAPHPQSHAHQHATASGPAAAAAVAGASGAAASHSGLAGAGAGARQAGSQFTDVAGPAAAPPRPAATTSSSQRQRHCAPVAAGQLMELASDDEDEEEGLGLGGLGGQQGVKQQQQQQWREQHPHGSKAPIGPAAAAVGLGGDAGSWRLGASWPHGTQPVAAAAAIAWEKPRPTPQHLKAKHAQLAQQRVGQKTW